MVACDAVVSGTWEEAWVKTTDWRAKASRCGVNPRCEPRNPMRSARIVSSVIRMTLGSRGAGGRGAAAPAIALATEQRTHSKPRVRNIGYKKSIIGGFVASYGPRGCRTVEGRAPREPALSEVEGSSRAESPGTPCLTLLRLCGRGRVPLEPFQQLSRLGRKRRIGESLE